MNLLAEYFFFFEKALVQVGVVFVDLLLVLQMCGISRSHAKL